MYGRGVLNGMSCPHHASLPSDTAETVRDAGVRVTGKPSSLLQKSFTWYQGMELTHTTVWWHRVYIADASIAN